MQLSKLNVLSTAFIALASTWISDAYASEQRDRSGQADWSGFYVGVGLGETFTKNSVDYEHHANSCSNNNYGSNGAGPCGGNQNYGTSFLDNLADTTGSLRAGYNWQLDNAVVVGVEPSVNLYHQSKVHYQVISTGFGDNLTVRSEQNYSVNFQGNIGMPVDDFLFYLSCGPTMTSVKTNITQVDVNGSLRYTNHINKNELKLGMVFGGGVKYHLAKNWVLGGEFTAATLTNSQASAPRIFAANSGGILFPDTRAVNKNFSETMLLSVSYQF